jgi:predicted pyridoxine 5'-phosphate oxidase superfamily flavin-nucleotide-binding protein
VLDERTLAFADFAGNRQYITAGNLSENPKAQLLMIDYARRMRVKIWGEARVEETDGDLIAGLMPRDYKARAEHAIVFAVSAWDANCKQHIPQRFDVAEVNEALKLRDERIAGLEAEVRRLREAIPRG